MESQEFLQFLKSESHRWMREDAQNGTFVLAYIVKVDGTGFAQITRAGEAFPDNTYYPTIGPWTPEKGQLIICAQNAGGLVILGALNTPYLNQGGVSGPNGIDGTNWKFIRGRSNTLINTGFTKTINTVGLGSSGIDPAHYVFYPYNAFSLSSISPAIGTVVPKVFITRTWINSQVVSNSELIETFMLHKQRVWGFSWWVELSSPAISPVFFEFDWLAVGLTDESS